MSHGDLERDRQGRTPGRALYLGTGIPQRRSALRDLLPMVPLIPVASNGHRRFLRVRDDQHRPHNLVQPTDPRQLQVRAQSPRHRHPPHDSDGLGRGRRGGRRARRLVSDLLLLGPRVLGKISINPAEPHRRTVLDQLRRAGLRNLSLGPEARVLWIVLRLARSRSRASASSNRLFLRNSVPAASAYAT